MKLVVIGQGYVGLPVSMLAVLKGMEVIGLDVNRERTESLQRGVSYIDDVADEVLQTALASGRFKATDDYASMVDFEVCVVTVPTPLVDAGPDLSYLVSSATELAPHIREGSTVIVESTTYPGTTEDVVRPILEAGSGLVAGANFALGFSPERIDPGNRTWSLENTPKIVSGIGDYSLHRVKGFYDELVDETVPVPSPREAELAKLLENTFRHVNIAMVNELLVVASELGIDLWSSIDAAATKPFGFMKFTPGPGVGGHCLPIDPTYLSWEVKRRVGRSLGFIELANEINAGMPRYVVDRVVRVLNMKGKAARGARVVLLGLGYKPNSGDVRESPAVRVAELLADMGCLLSGVDALVPRDRFPRGVVPVDFDVDQLRTSDLIVLLTDHEGIDYESLVETGVPLLDTRNRLRSSVIGDVHRI